VMAWAARNVAGARTVYATGSDAEAARLSGIDTGRVTLCVFAGLTASVFITRADFSFLGPILAVAMFLMLGVIIAAIFFPPVQGLLGLGFSFVMVALMAGYILYDTSNVIHHFRTDQHVAAALELFADVALMFWYVLRILMELQRR